MHSTIGRGTIMVVEKTSRIRKRYIILVIILLALYHWKLPYYYSAPGGAEELAPFVNVEGGYKNEEGNLMLTTVLIGKANPYFYVWSQFSDYRHLVPEEQIVGPGETDEDYFHRQEMLMEHSQESAKIIAYKKAGKEVEIEYKGILVTSFIEGMPAEKVLERNDRIVAVEGREVRTVPELNTRIGQREAGEKIALTVVRDGEKQELSVPIGVFPEAYGNDGRVGLGILYPVAERQITFEPKVDIDVRKIGGPSAGLMFSLEIYNQLVPEDITKGYRIAGTGTIDEQGNVGRIGGVKQKVMAAHKAGADIFFAPKEGEREDSNYNDAVEAAEDIGTDVKIIGVNTIDDAISYMRNLEEKKS